MVSRQSAFRLFAALSIALVATAGFAQSTVTLNATSGTGTISTSYTTTGGLTLGLGFFAEYLVVGGGGGGGGSGNSTDAWGGGGGGAGGLLTGTTTLSATSYAVTVGGGGAGGQFSATAANQQGSNGASSVFGSFATGTGGGGGGRFKVAGNDGGSGGGGGGRGTGNDLRTAGGNGTAGQGRNGGASRDDDSIGRSAGGGGGGAGAVGGTGGTNVTTAGDGGAGLASSITGANVTYAGGGGGGAWDTFDGETAGTAGTGGGGAGSTSGNATAGTDSLGGGGGGVGTNGAGGRGGSGIVILRYQGASLGNNIGGTVTTGSGSAAGYTLHTFTTSGTTTLNTSFNLSGVDMNARLGATLTGTISGSGALTFAGPGRLTLAASNSFTGDTRITSGTLGIGNANALQNSTLDMNANDSGAITFSQASTIGGLKGSRDLSIFGNWITVGGNNSSTVYSGNLSSNPGSPGSGKLIKIGNGKLTLAANNDYSGQITVSSGTLELGNGGTAGAIAGDIVNNSMLVFNRSDTVSYNRRITGTGSLTKQGAGTLELTAFNDFSGDTRVSSGTLAIGQSDALMSSTLDMNASDSGAITFSQSSRLGGLKGSRNLDNGGHTLGVGVNNASTTYSGELSGTGGLIKQGTGTLTLSGNNTYSGLTTVSGGTLAIGAGGTTGAIAGNIANSGVVVFNRSDAAAYAGSISGTGSLTKQGAGTLTLSGSSSFTGDTRVAAGTLAVGNADALSGSTLGMNYGDSGSVTFSQASTIGGIKDYINLANAGYALTVGGNNSTTQLYGQLSGSGALIKTGSGTLSLWHPQNGFTGDTRIASGTLAIGNIYAIANSTLDMNASDSGALTFLFPSTLPRLLGGLKGSRDLDNDGKTLFIGANNQSTTYAGAISGSGGLTKQGTGTLTLAGNNTFTGNTQISSGNLAIGAGGTTGAIAGNIYNSGAVVFNRSDASTYAGNISGAGSLTKLGAGALTLTGVNTFTGDTTVSAGTLILGSGNALSSRAAVTVSSGATLQATAPIRIFYIDSQGTVVGGENLTATATVTRSGNIGGIANGTDSQGTFEAGIAKLGSGTSTVNAVNTYTGLTRVKEGTLVTGLANAFAAASDLQIDSGATLDRAGFSQTVTNADIDGTVGNSGGGGLLTVTGTLSGSGLVNGDVLVNGVHAPGNSPGVQTFDGNLSYGNGAIVNWELIANTQSNSPVVYDQIVLSNAANLTFSGSNVLSLSFNGAGSLVNWTDSFWDVNRAWTVFDLASGVTTGFGNLSLGGSLLDANSLALDAGTRGYFSLAQSGQDVTLVFTAVPEPSTLVLGAVGIAGAVWLRRRRLRVKTARRKSSIATATQGLADLAAAIPVVVPLHFSASRIASRRSAFRVFAALSIALTATAGFAQSTVTLNATSGTGTISTNYTTNGGLTLGLGFFAEYLVVGGGGGGGGSGNSTDAWGGGGGGAGGMLTGTAQLSSNATYSAIVGGGGAGGQFSATAANQQGSNGANSVFGDFATATGGGGGGRFKVAGNSGGSGGGGGGRGTGTDLRTPGGNGTAGQGKNGGASRDDDSSGRSAGGGGGGALTVGGTGGTNVTTAGDGGAGLASSITGTSVTYAGGGGGGAWDTFDGETAGTGGLGGGGAGSTNGTATPGTDNYGGGGGGVGTNGAGGRGGSGIVIVRYQGASLGNNIGGTVTTGSGSAAGYTLHTFTTTGTTTATDALDLWGISLNERLGVTLTGAISGTGGLTFAGPGTLRLSGSNSFTGDTTISFPGGGNAPTLVIANANALAGSTLNPGNGNMVFSQASNIGGLKGTVNFGNGGNTLTIGGNNQSTTYRGDILGSGGFIKTGTGTLTVTGGRSFTYTGDTRIASGTLVVGSNWLTNSTLDMNASDSGAIRFDWTRCNLGGLKGSRNVANGGTLLRVGFNNQSTVYSGVLSGTGGLDKWGTGTLTLTGNNTYTGTTKLYVGTLTVGDGGTSGSLASDVNLWQGASLIFNRSDASTYAGSIIGAGSLTKLGAGALTLTGANTFTGDTAVSAGTLVLGSGNALATTAAVTVASGATLQATTPIRIGYIDSQGTVIGGEFLTATFTVTQSGNIGGIANGSDSLGTFAAGIVKLSSGTSTVNAANTYTGLTWVREGTLAMGVSNAFAAASDLTVDSGATLDRAGYSQTVTNAVLNGTVGNAGGGGLLTVTGTLSGSGSVNGDVTVTGVHAPGNSPGVQTFDGNLSYGNGAVVNWELIANTQSNSPVVYDQIVLSNAANLTFSGSNVLSLSFNGAGSLVDWTDSFWDVNRAWTVFDLAAGATTGFGNLSLGGSLLDANSLALDAGTRGSFSLAQSGQDVVLQFTAVAVPEPSTWLMGLAGIACCGWSIRRRRMRA